MKRRQKEQLFNALGFLTSSQKEKIKTINKLKKIPVVDDSIKSKEPHELTFQEFTSTYFRSIVEKGAPLLADKSLEDIFEKVSVKSLKQGISDSMSIARKTYFEIIMNALKKKLPGIPAQTISEIRFQAQFLKCTRSYLKFYSDQYSAIL